MEIFNHFSVLILDESTVHQDLLSNWITEVSVKTVSKPVEIPSKLDPSMAVACLSQETLADDSESVQKHILSRNPYCQIVGIIPRSSFVSPYEDQFDEVLQRPLFKKEFQECIECRLVTAVYTTLLGEIYHTNTKLTAVQRASDDEIHDKEKFAAEMRQRSEYLNLQLDLIQDKLTSDAILNSLQTLNRHNQYFSESEMDQDDGQGTKYHPRRCPSCKLPWGVDHRNDLGNGFVTLGADVCQCTRCHNIVHGLAGEQRVL